MATTDVFLDRREAGQVLAERLMSFSDDPEAVVLALPRGGVPVAFEVATSLRLPLDVVVVRKLGVPGHRELAMGAIASGGIRVLDRELVRVLGIGEDDIAETARHELEELQRRERAYRGDREALDVEGTVAIVVDDGIATGSTMKAALSAVRRRGPAKLIAAVPVASRSGCDALAEVADEVVCATTPEPFRAVGQWYRQFDQTTDDTVTELLGAAREIVPDRS